MVVVGNGNDHIHVGNGNNIIVEGNGNDNITDGDGDNLIVAGLGYHDVHVGDGSNILIDGTISLPIAMLSQVLNDWIDYGKTKSEADYNNIQQTLSQSVTYNTQYANTLHADGDLDWFWATDTHDHLNVKKGDLLN
jgi:Ca2+-binding RTX toxin-like protein